MKVYVVTEGWYSDYHIECVTLSKEQANKYIERKSSRYTDYEIEEYDTNELDEFLADGRGYWMVWKTDGRIASNPTDAPTPCNKIDINKVKQQYPKRKGNIFTIVRADTKEEAEKIACDLFTKFEAKKAGVM